MKGDRWGAGVHGHANGAGPGLAGDLSVGVGVRGFNTGEHQNEKEAAEHDQALQQALFELAFSRQDHSRQILPGLTFLPDMAT